MIPVSIAYDQIQDVPDYALEAQGKGKQRESLGWCPGASGRCDADTATFTSDSESRSRSPTRSGRRSPKDDEASIGLQKLGFEVMYRIGQVTPITPTAIVTIALLAARGSARTADQLAEECARLSEFVGRSLDPDHRGPRPIRPGTGVGGARLARRARERLESRGSGTTGLLADEDQMVRIAYYRNVIVHFFLPGPWPRWPSHRSSNGNR